MRTSHSLITLLKRDDTNARLDELCEFAPNGDVREELVLWFVRLVEWLRPSGNVGAAARVRFLETRLDSHPEWHANVSRAVASLVKSCDVEQLMAFGGIPRDFHFMGAVREWLSSRFLPRACATSDGANVVRLAFVERDATWIRQSGLLPLFRKLLPEDLRVSLVKALDNAMLDLAHSIIALAHGPTVRALSRAERSPFRGLYAGVSALVEDPSAAHANSLRGRIRQCLTALEGTREELAVRGADLNTTFQLQRMRQQLHRLAHLAEVRHEPSDDTVRDACAALVLTIHRNTSGNRLLGRSSELLVGNLVDTTASMGRHYLDPQSSTWWAAFRAGAGGGLLMALATIAKYSLAKLHLPPFYEGLVFSLNYAAVFCAAYLLHFTIATKLPAHTATALARSVQESGGRRARVGHFLEIWRAMVRLQFAGLVGNVIIAGPLAAAIDYGVWRGLHRHVLDMETSEHVLHAQSILGPSILFATITGLFLWVSSLMGAGADNWTRVAHLRDRLATNVHVMKRLSLPRARGIADGFVGKVGGLVSNVSLGFMLGSVPAAFAIAQLPIEIRHVTVSTSAVALAIMAGAGTHQSIALAASGVLAIGLVNVVVSFMLSLWLALRSSNANAYVLVRLGIRRWWRRTPAPRVAAEPMTAPGI